MAVQSVLTSEEIVTPEASLVTVQQTGKRFTATSSITISTKLAMILSA